MTEKKDILVFSDWFLPGYRAGGPIRSLANLVNTIDYNFYVVTRITDHHSSEPYPGIPAGEWVKFSSNTMVMYLHENQVTEDRLKPIITDAKFHRIYINSLFSPLFALRPLWIARKSGLSSKVIVSPRGMLKKGALSVKPLKKKVFLKTARLFGWFDGVTWEATNAQEASEIQAHFGKDVRFHIAPNLAEVPAEKCIKIHKEKGHLKLICVARISKEKGILEALLYLRNAQLSGRVEVDFYGAKQNAAYLKECEDVAATMPDFQIAFHGEITPNELPAKLDQAHFFYMPTLGENYGHAIVEALTHCTPVIISDRTPWRNLERINAGWDLPLNGDSFAPVLKHCLEMENEEYKVWCDKAYEHGCAEAKSPETLAAAYALFD